MSHPDIKLSTSITSLPKDDKILNLEATKSNPYLNIVNGKERSDSIRNMALRPAPAPPVSTNVASQSNLASNLVSVDHGKSTQRKESNIIYSSVPVIKGTRGNSLANIILPSYSQQTQPSITSPLKSFEYALSPIEMTQAISDGNISKKGAPQIIPEVATVKKGMQPSKFLPEVVANIAPSKLITISSVPYEELPYETIVLRKNLDIEHLEVVPN